MSQESEITAEVKVPRRERHLLDSIKSQSCLCDGKLIETGPWCRVTGLAVSLKAGGVGWGG